MLKLIGICYDGNSSYLKGPAEAPARIRLMDSEGSANSYTENGTEILKDWNYLDLGDLHFEEEEPLQAYHLIKEKISRELSGSDKICCLGGDHSISYPIIETHCQLYKNLHLLHFDAHADLYEKFDDNPFSHASPFARILEKNLVKSLTQVGIRTLNSHQREQVKRYGVRVIEMRNFSFDFIKDLNGPLYVSLDLDVLDPAFAPGISHHEPGGLSSRELIRLIQKISVPVIGADIVEYNPKRDLNNMTAMVAFKLMKELFAKMME
jgi:arginase